MQRPVDATTKDEDDGTPTWAWFVIGLGALTGVSLAARAYRRRDGEPGRFRTVEDVVDALAVDATGDGADER